MFCISLVDEPAVESEFIAFAKEDEIPMNFSVQDEEQHIVFGVVMKADTPILRYHKDYGNFYMVFDKETIKKMAEQYLTNGYQNNVNLDHNPDNYVQGVNMLEWFIKDSEKGINPAGFEDVPEGSLFASFKVNNEEVWNSIKEGTFKGFSLEGMFGLVPEQFKKINNVKNDIIKMANKKLNKIKAMLKNILLEFNEVATDKGVLRWNGEETEELPVEGADVYVVDEEENEVAAESGEYVVDELTTIVVEDGKVKEVIIKEEEKTEEEAPAEAEVVEEILEDEKPEEKEEEKSEEPAEEEAPATDVEGDVDAAIDELEALKAKIEELEKENAQLRDKVAELENKPAAESAVEEFKAITAPAKTNDEKLNNLRRVMNAK